ncbi:oligosaccharide flippase family protein [Thalassospira sp. 11-3]|uniref:oligosaccharide flippase family protein n=1 Tax=Thalassospira sp. 11-3 TaxID=2135614 RepID=UPI0011B5BD8A|nr:oligosaccharide flippase family protein [Thalassospira sp. 11-3]
MKFAAIFVLFANAFSAGMMFLISLLISRYGGKEIFGFFSVILGLIVAATPVATFGMDAAIVRFLPVYRSEGRGSLVSRIQRFVLFFSGSISLLGGLGLAVLLVNFRGYDWGIGISTGVCLPLSVVLVVSQGIIRANENVSIAVMPEAIVRPLIFSICISVFLFARMETLSLISIVFSYAIALIFSNFFAFIVIIKKRYVDWNFESRIGFKDIRLWLNVGASVVFSNISISLINQSPVIVAGIVLSAFDAGEIGAVSRLAMLVSFALTAVNSIITPFLSRAIIVGDKMEVQSIVTRAMAFSIFIAVPVCIVFYLFSPFLLSAFGADYLKAVPFLRIMLCAYVVHVAAGPSISLLNISGLHKVTSRIMMLWTCLVLCGLLISMTVYGISGGVLVAAISTAGYPLLLAVICYKALGIDTTIFSLRFLLQR